MASRLAVQFAALLLVMPGAALAADAPPSPSLLSPKAACRLARPGIANASRRIYSIKGQYLDQEHGAILTPDGCAESFMSGLNGEAYNKNLSFHSAFNDKCHGNLMNTFISGVFTGTFVRDKAPHKWSFAGRTLMVRDTRFIVTNFASPTYDPSSVSCGK